MLKIIFLFSTFSLFNLFSFAQNVGIGTITPTARLEVVGELKVVDGTQGAGKILTSDSTGRASWQSPPPSPGTNELSVRICCQLSVIQES